MTSIFLKSDVGVVVRTILCRFSNSRKLLGRKVLGIYLKLILDKKIFHKNLKKTTNKERYPDDKFRFDSNFGH